MNTIEVAASVDALGDPEEFTWDLYPLVPAEQTQHLDENGLPKIGTLLQPGMIVVGKIGKSVKYDRGKQPTAREIHTTDFESVRSKYGDSWINTSLYATEEHVGRVVSAKLMDKAGKQWAVIEVN